MLASGPPVATLGQTLSCLLSPIKSSVTEYYVEITRNLRIALVVSEQMLGFALDVADRILILEKGAFIHEEARKDIDLAKIKQYLTV